MPTWLHSSSILLCSQKTKNLATELNANTLAQQTSEYVKGTALHWEEGITSSTARWLTDSNSYQLFRSRHQQKCQTVPAFRVEKQVKPSLCRHTRVAMLLQDRSWKCSCKGLLPGSHTDMLEHGPTRPCLFTLLQKPIAVDRAAVVALETRTKAKALTWVLILTVLPENTLYHDNFLCYENIRNRIE